MRESRSWSLNNNTKTAYETNIWYQTVQLFVKKAVINTSCYVCAYAPHSSEGVVPVVPWPLNTSEVLGVMVAMTLTFVDNFRITEADNPKQSANQMNLIPGMSDS